MQKKVLLMILDGWGVTQNPEISAISKANTPYIDSLYLKSSNAQLRTDGINVGLPEGQMGNSEVGHINLGAGRIVYQDFAKINLAVNNGNLSKEPVLQNAFSYAKKNKKKVHLIGLVSNGGVHSHINHIKGLLSAAKDADLKDVFVHAFTDGRDVDPHSGKGFISEIQDYTQQTTGKLATVVGRYYAMDRDQRWERTKITYDLLVKGIGSPSKNILKSIEDSYQSGISDEFIKPIFLTENEEPIATIEENDVVLFFNFRTDRGRQLTHVLSQNNLPEFNMKTLPLHFVTMTNYDDSFQNIHVIYNKENVTETLGEVLSKAGKTQIRIAETEKYPHVTFFFSGGREQPFEGEKRILCPSPKVATYDLQPEMSAYEVRDKIIPEIEQETADFICLNFANPDMVGHTGVFEAAIKACETIDSCTKSIVEKATKHKYTTIIIADHGNSETMVNPDGSANTAHTTNPVPIIVVDNEIKHVENGILANIAPTILKLMGIDKPKIMNEKPLI